MTKEQQDKIYKESHEIIRSKKNITDAEQFRIICKTQIKNGFYKNIEQEQKWTEYIAEIIDKTNSWKEVLEVLRQSKIGSPYDSGKKALVYARKLNYYFVTLNIPLQAASEVALLDLKVEGY